MKLISKKRYLQTFGICVIVLAIVRAAFPEVAGGSKHDKKNTAADSLEMVAVKEDTIVKNEALHTTPVAVMATPETPVAETPATEVPEVPERYQGKLSTRLFFNADGSLVHHRI